MTCDPWPIRWACDIEDVDPTLLALAQDSAQSLLWSLTGRRYGVCTTTEWYRPPCDSPCVQPWVREFGPGVDWRVNRTYGWLHDCCHLTLSQTPVRAVLEVEVLGDVLPETEYALELDRLMRYGECWPCDEGCDDPPVKVTYAYGIDVPALGELAMGELACEFLAALTGADCRLPSNAISVTRQGITVDLGDQQTLFEMGRIGLPISDAFIRSVNPNKLQSQSKVWTPDTARRAR